MRHFILILVALVAGIAGGVWLLRSLWHPPEVSPAVVRGSRDARSVAADGVDPAAGGPDGAAPSTTASTAARRTAAPREAEIVFCAQVDEVDRCIDPTGTELLLTDLRDGRQYRATIQKGGGAVFENVALSYDPRELQLRTPVPDKRCYPERLHLSLADCSGSPLQAGVSVALVHIHELRGTVRDATTQLPVAGATVAIDSFTVSEATSAADGAFCLNLNEPAGTVTVNADGYQELLWGYPDPATAPALPDHQDFALVPDGISAYLTVRGFVTPGVPAANAALSVTVLAQHAVSDAALDLVAAAEQANFLHALAAQIDGLGAVVGMIDVVPEKLDGMGTARLKMVIPGRLRIDASTGEQCASLDVDVRPGEHKEVLLHFLPCRQLDVLVAMDGEACGGVSVELTDDRGGQRSCTSNHAGRASFRDLPNIERAWLSVRPQRINGSEAWLVAAGQAVDMGEELPAEVEFTVHRAFEQTGRVLDADTLRPIAGAAIEATFGTARSDGEGGFRLALVAGEVVTIAADGYRRTTIVFAGGALPAITLVPLSVNSNTALRLRVVDAEGVTCANASLALTATIDTVAGVLTGEQSWHGRVAADGNGPLLRWALAPEERVVVRVSVESVARQIAVDTITLAAGAAVDHVVTLRARAEVRGVVVLNSGVPMAGAHVTALQDVLEQELSETVVADSEGRFKLDCGAGGKVWVKVTAPLRAALVELEVPAAGFADLTIAVQPVHEVVMRVVDAVDGRKLRASARGPFMPIDGGTWRVPQGVAVPIAVSARGYATRRIVVPPAVGAPLVVALHPIH